MAGISFSHKIGTLNLRLPPTQVEWSYKMNTNTYTTYGGEVVQVLGVNFDKVSFQGQFGKEGAHGKNLIRRDGKLLLQDRPVSEYTNWNTSEPYGVGLSQMAEWFKTYFSAASQGRDDDPYDLHYDQDPVIVRYEGANDIQVDKNKGQTEWKVYPTSFPSFRRSNDNFAPEWRVECEVYESPFPISGDEYADLFERLKEGVGWKPVNKFSDPIAAALANVADAQDKKQALDKAIKERDKVIDQIIEYYRDIVPVMTPEAIEELILSGASMVNVYNLNKKNKHRNRPQFAIGPGGIIGISTPTPGAGETDEDMMSRTNPPPSYEGENYGKGQAPLKFTGEFAGPGSDDRFDLSYTKKIGPNRYVDSTGRVYDEKGRIV